MRHFILFAIIPLFTMACFGLQFPGYDHDEQPTRSSPPTEEPLPTPDSGQTIKVPHVITDVEVMILESDPLQVQLQVTGHQTDGCEFPVQVEQRRDGTEFYVEVYRNVPIAATCIQILVDYSETILLEGPFESGESFTIHVNDFTVDITL